MTEDKKPPESNDQDKHSNGDKVRSKAFYIRLTIIYAVCILLVILVINYDSFANTLNKFAAVLMPLLYGFIIAYLCNPLYNLFFEKALVKLRSVRWRKVLSLVLTYIVVILLIFAMLFVLIQQLVINVQNFLLNIDTYIKNAEAFIFDIIDSFGFIKSEDNAQGGTVAPPDITGPIGGTEETTTAPPSSDSSSTEDGTTAPTPDFVIDENTTYYWIETGDVFHLYRSCRYLRRSPDVLSGYEEDLEFAKKNAPCEACLETANMTLEEFESKFENSGSVSTTEDLIDPDEPVRIFDFSFTKEGLIEMVSDFLSNSVKIISQIGNIIVDSGTTAVLTIFNVFLGFIFSVYILTERDMLCAKAKKITIAIFPKEKANRYIALANYSNAKIGHFIKGKLLESVIVGIMAYLLFLIFRIPSPLMIAMIVAIMNMIPFFGPFLGAIPAALIVLIIDPSKTIAYIIIVVIIMQINGNYISPKIVGNSTGLTPFGAMTALVLMSGYFGIIGMFIGIPICAIVVELLWREMKSKLDEKGLSDNLDDYYSPEALAVLNEERAHPSRHRNLTAVVVDEAILLFNIVFRRHKLKENQEKQNSKNGADDQTEPKPKKQKKKRDVSRK